MGFFRGELTFDVVFITRLVKCTSCHHILYTPLFSRTVIFAVLARCGNSRVVNFAILLMLSLL